MYESFDVCSSSGHYSVSIEPGIFDRLLTKRRNDVFLVDTFFCEAAALLVARARAVFFYEASEAIKSLEAVPALIEDLRKAGATRQTQVVAIGGGTVQDLAAFTASIYMRGLHWIYIPTTLLGMVDSCIGGKSSINVGRYKNLVGTFHPPASVFIDPELASTLPPEQQAAGLVEAAKICYCHSFDCFRDYLACHPQPGMDAAQLATLISLSLRAKKWFIERDEFDEKERLLLNFGHTFGHAIEGASDYAIAHGLAVGVGMLCALRLSRERLAVGALSDETARAKKEASAQVALRAPGGPGLDLPEIDSLEEHVCGLPSLAPELSQQWRAGVVEDETARKRNEASAQVALRAAGGPGLDAPEIDSLEERVCGLPSLAPELSQQWRAGVVEDETARKRNEASAQVALRAAGGPGLDVAEIDSLEEHVRDLLSFAPGLSGRLRGLDLDVVIERFESDKKHTQDCYVLILVSATGAVVMEALPKSPRSRQWIRTAFATVVEGFLATQSSDRTVMAGGSRTL